MIRQWMKVAMTVMEERAPPKEKVSHIRFISSRKPTRFKARLWRNWAAAKRKQRALLSDSNTSLSNASMAIDSRKKTGKK